MEPYIDYVRQAKKIPYNERKGHLLTLPETELHQELKSLFEKLAENDLVEITHGRDESGRDLVIKHTNAWGEKFIAIIVKKGNSSGKLTGESDGVVQKLINQMGQALSNQCPLKEIHAGAVDISEIKVIFVGTLTHNAVWRVENEIKAANVQVCSLGWLVDRFTDHYPEVFFQGRLAEFMRDSVSVLETKREFSPRPSMLSESFVNPWVLEIEAPANLTEAIVDTFRSRRLPFKELEDIVQTTKKVVIIGDPGTGKSTVLRKIALDEFEKCIQSITSRSGVDKLEIPILLRARDLVSKGITELIEGIMPEEPVRKRLSVKVLLVDGLDEVKVGNRPKILSDLEDYSDKNQCSLVITTRKVEALREAIVPFKQYELLPFEYKQAIDFLHRSVKDEELFRILDEGLKRDDLRISFIPLALELLIEIATIEREIPASITEIFERFTDSVLGRYDIAKGIDSVFEYFIKKKFLAELAWQEFFSKDRLVIPNEEFNYFVEAYKKKYKRIRTKLDQFLVEIDRAGILRVSDVVFFRHRSFLEFFTSYRLAQHRGEYENLNEDIVETYFDLMWTEVAFYYIGILREIPEPIVEILDKYDEDTFEAMVLKGLIGKLLQAGWDTPSDIKVKAMSIAMRQLEPLRTYLDNAIESQATPAPPICADFFVMALSEYSFGSRTFSDEVVILCDSLANDHTWNATWSCLLLLWANRSRLSPDQTKELAELTINTLAQLESKQELAVRDKYISLFMLEHIEKEDAKLLKSIKRKLANVRRLYPAEIRRLLPPAGGKVGFRVKARRTPKTKR